MKYFSPILVLLISGIFAAYQFFSYESHGEISTMSILSDIFVTVLLFAGLLIIQRMRRNRRLYWVLMSGFTALYISLLTDVLDEFLAQPGFITTVFEDVFQIIGYVLVLAGIWLWITHNKEITDELKRLATTDNLTGAHNRRQFRETIWHEINRVVRYGEALTLVAFDIDHFKAVNDTFGHIRGDEVLKKIAEIVRDNIRTTDIFARTGGEEFALIAPSTDPASASEIAERLRETINSHSFDSIGTVTVSFGVAGFKKGDNINTFIDRADKALYNAKELGRNSVEIAG
ncbi:MAG: GGDEF domain-containing protein [Candidatus Adiutricales bacterium]